MFSRIAAIVCLSALLVVGLAGCADDGTVAVSGQPGGAVTAAPSGAPMGVGAPKQDHAALMAQIKATLDEKAKVDPQFAAWVKASGRFSPADLAGKWDWMVGQDDPKHGFVFYSTKSQLDLKYDKAAPNALAFDIKNEKSNPKGKIVVDSGKLNTLTFYTTTTPNAKGETSQVPAGFYVAMYIVAEGQAGLILWDPARDAFFQAKRVATEKFRGLGDGGDSILPELPPVTGQTNVPTPTPTPGITPTITPQPTVVNPIPTPPQVLLPKPKPVGSLVGVWQLIPQVNTYGVDTFIVFKGETYETYMRVSGSTVLMDAGVYAQDGATLTTRSNVTGNVSTVTLAVEGNVLTASGHNGVLKFQKVQ